RHPGSLRHGHETGRAGVRVAQAADVHRLVYPRAGRRKGVAHPDQPADDPGGVSRGRRIVFRASDEGGGMKVSKRGQYGMRALCHLAETHGSGVVQIRETARRESIPAKFLEGILLELKHAGIVRSRRGIDGGYELARYLSEIMLGQVMRVLDGPLAPLGSAAELNELMKSDPRQAGFYSVLIDVRDAAAAILDQTTLAEV